MDVIWKFPLAAERFTAASFPGHLQKIEMPEAEAGDTIVCHDEAMQKLGEAARVRMCPDKPLEFELEVTP